MQRKRSIHIPKGMTKDVSDSKLGSEYYIDALNIRLTAHDDNTLMLRVINKLLWIQL